MSDIRGLPLLSGPAPPMESPSADDACRKCNKEFNILFARSRKCNHCGYSYCHSCSDYQAMMPRSGAVTGYDAVPVCAFCIELLTITAAGRHQLKTMSLAKLKKYINAYNIKIDRAVEKDDLIDAIISAKGPNGCLSPANENYYRKYSVPNKPQGRPRGLFSRQPPQGQSSNGPPPPIPPRTDNTPEFARPDLAPDGPSPPQSQAQSHSTYPPPPRPPPQQQPQQQQYNAPPYPPPPRSQSAYSNAPPPHNPPPQFHTPPPPPPSPQHGYGYPGQEYRRAQPHPPPPPPQHSRPPPQVYRGATHVDATFPIDDRSRRPTFNVDTRFPNQTPQQPPYPQHHQPQYTSHHQQPQYPQPHRPQYTSHAPPPPPPPPRPRVPSTPSPPTLDQLLSMTPTAIGALGIGVLKSVLFTNHVHAGQVLEKGDLVKKVLSLVEDERAERERMRRAEEREEMERVQREQERREEEARDRERREQREREREQREGNATAEGPGVDATAAGDEQSDSPSPSHPEREPSPTPPKAPAVTTVPPPKTQGSASTLERTGLCVICQDEEANIAIVDCGHMAMCRGCSDLVMASSRECPLCRTRIVTEQRLLRIFKT